MANIFSGLFGNSGNSGTAAAQYKSRLEEFERQREYRRRNEDLINQSKVYDSAIQDMTPERQRAMKLYQMMAGGQTTGDKGLEAINKGFSQRGATLADIISQEKNTLESNLRHQYKVDNPIAGDETAKIAVAKQFIDWWRSNPDNDQTHTDAELAQLAWRQEQFIKQQDQSVSTVTGGVISDRLLEGGITKKLVPEYTDRLNNFFPHIDDSEDLLLFSQNRRDDIQKLYKDTNNWTTGIGSALALVNPYSEAARWEDLKETIVSNIGLAKIMELKAGSAQGATGLGALNEKELQMLQDHAGRLRGAQNQEELKRILRRLDRDLKGMQRRVMSGLSREKTFYNDYKQYLPHAKKDDPIWAPPEESKHLFTGDDYVRPEIESPLDEVETDEQRLERIMSGG